MSSTPTLWNTTKVERRYSQGHENSWQRFAMIEAPLHDLPSLKQIRLLTCTPDPHVALHLPHDHHEDHLSKI